MKGLYNPRPVDDTPVDGQLAHGVTSNWAFDHVADLEAHYGLPFNKDYKLFHIPTTYRWTAAVTGSGGSDQQLTRIYVRTAATASSTARLYSPLFWLRPGGTSAYIDWGKKLWMAFSIKRASSDAEVVARFQLKEVGTEGVLAAEGFGIQIDNLTLYGETYDTEVAKVDLNTVLTDGNQYDILIVHTPGTGIEWFVDKVSKGTSTREPTTTSAAAPNLVLSIIRGATGATDSWLDISPIYIAQER